MDDPIDIEVERSTDELISPVEVSQSSALQAVSELLSEVDYNYAGPGSQLAKLLDHKTEFSPKHKKGKVDFANKSKLFSIGGAVEDLLMLESQYQVQLERLELLREIFAAPRSTADELNDYLESEETAYEIAFKASLAHVRAEIRESEVEEAVQCMHSFLTEAHGNSHAAQQLIYVLNAPPEVFDEKDFYQVFNKLSNVGAKFDDTYALWVTNATYSDSGEFLEMAGKAEFHKAIVFVNADMDQIAYNKRVDVQERRGGSKKPEPLSEGEINGLNRLISGDPAGEHVIVCANSIRVRRGDLEYAGEYEDSVIPCSFAYAGKVFWVSNVNPETCEAVDVAQLSQKFELKKSNAVEVSGAHGPILYSYDRNRDHESVKNVVNLVWDDRGIETTDKGVFLIHFDGSHTAYREGKSITEKLTEVSLARLKAHFEVRYKGSLKTKAKEIKAEVDSILDRITSESDDSKPLKSYSSEVVDSGIKIHGEAKKSFGSFDVDIVLE